MSRCSLTWGRGRVGSPLGPGHAGVPLRMGAGLCGRPPDAAAGQAAIPAELCKIRSQESAGFWGHTMALCHNLTMALTAVLTCFESLGVPDGLI